MRLDSVWYLNIQDADLHQLIREINIIMTYFWISLGFFFFDSEKNA